MGRAEGGKTEGLQGQQGTCVGCKRTLNLGGAVVALMVKDEGTGQFTRRMVPPCSMGLDGNVFSVGGGKKERMDVRACLAPRLASPTTSPNLGVGVAALSSST